MKINSFNNNQSPQITFGYDKGLNAKVTKELASNPSPLSLQLLQLNKLCNETEDKIELSENAGKYCKDGYDSDESDTLLDIFVSLKATFAQAVDRLFPDLNYIDLEKSHYAKAANGDAESWQHYTVGVLNDTAEACNGEAEPQNIKLDKYSKPQIEAIDVVESKYFDLLQVDSPTVSDINPICAWKN